MANALGIDVGEIYRTVEAVKASRAERGLEERKYANTLATQEATAAVAATGGKDQSAMAKLIAINPEQAKKLTDLYTGMDEAARKKQKDQIDVLGNMAAGILSAPDPAAAYAEARAKLPPEAQEHMPADYNENWVKFQLGQATEAAKIFESIDGDRTAERDQKNKLIVQDDQQAHQSGENVLERQNKLEVAATERKWKIADDEKAFQNDLAKIIAKAEADKGGGGLIDAKDTSPIYKQSIELLGGIFDQNGNLQNLDPNTRAKAQEIAVRASQKFATGTFTHADAVKQAAQELGLTFPKDGGGDAGADLKGDFLNIFGDQ